MVVNHLNLFNTLENKRKNKRVVGLIVELTYKCGWNCYIKCMLVYPTGLSENRIEVSKL